MHSSPRPWSPREGSRSLAPRRDALPSSSSRAEDAASAWRCLRAAAPSPERSALECLACPGRLQSVMCGCRLKQGTVAVRLLPPSSSTSLPVPSSSRTISTLTAVATLSDARARTRRLTSLPSIATSSSGTPGGWPLPLQCQRVTWYSLLPARVASSRCATSGGRSGRREARREATASSGTNTCISFGPTVSSCPAIAWRRDASNALATSCGGSLSRAMNLGAVLPPPPSPHE
mmetsp:Transcript_13579/g.32998  ORF Transcript_13579/g.32998 Transcript_13579/m.32998 type:complete len:233 (-) Transcript_13579:560-1258(-)